MKLQERLMGGLASFVIRYHKLIVPAMVILAALSVLAMGNIRMKTQTSDLLPKSNPRVESFDRIARDFAGAQSLMITVEGTDKKRMAAGAEALAAAIQRDPRCAQYVRAINLKLEEDFITRWGFMLQKSADIERSRKVFSEINLLGYLQGLNGSLEETYTGEAAEEQIETSKQENLAVASLDRIDSFTTLLTDYLEAPASFAPEEVGKTLVQTVVFGDLYTFSPDGGLLLFSVAPSFNIVEEEEKCAALTAEVKRLFGDVNRQYPDLSFGYTGEVGLRADDNSALSSDLLWPALLSYALILVLFLFSFNQLRAIVFALISLAAGILYNYGIVGVTIAEISMITSTVVALLIGMGIDYGIQVTTSFTTFLAEGYGREEAIRQTFLRQGIGMLLAAVTTSASFFVLMVSDSKGIFQLGLVAGLGILTCFLSMILLLPSLLLWFGKKGGSKPRIPNIDYGFLTNIGVFTSRHRWAAILIAAVLTGGFLLSSFGSRFEYDMMKLGPKQSISNLTYQKVLERFETNPMSASVMTDSIEEAQALMDVLEKKPGVAEVSSIASFVPVRAEQEQRLEEIAKFRARPGRNRPQSYSAADMGRFTSEVQRLEWNVIEVGDLSVTGLGEKNRIARKRNAMVREILGAEVGKAGREVFQNLIAALQKDPAASAFALSRLDKPFARELERIISSMAGADRTITVDDLPDSIAKMYLDGPKKRNLVTIIAKRGTTDNEKSLRAYNAMLLKTSPQITGFLPLSLDFLDEILSGAKKGALYVAIAVLVFTFLSFRSLKLSLLASLPMAMSVVWAFGTLSLTKTPLNALSLIVFPLNIGIGIAYGTYMTYRFLVEGRHIRRALDYTGKAVFLSATTTMAGFGSLAIAASFRALASFGTVLFIGISYCFLTTIAVLPALLALGKKRKNVAGKSIQSSGGSA